VEIVKLEINGKPWDEKATYTGAASDYFMGEAKRYLGVDVPHITYLQQEVFGAIEMKVSNEKVIDSKVENRIKEIK
jgi:hypothetical protein